MLSESHSRQEFLSCILWPKLQRCGSCVVFRFILCGPLNLNLYLFICCSWFVLWGSRWLVVHFHAGGKILSVWSGREKYGQHNRITSLVSAFLPCRDIPMGTHFCHANHTWISAGCFLSGHERWEDGSKRCKMGKRDKAPWGIVMPEIHRAPSWTEVTINSWPRIVLVLIAFKDESTAQLFILSHIVYADVHDCCLLIYGPDKTSTSVEVVLFRFSHRFSEAGRRLFQLS